MTEPQLPDFYTAEEFLALGDADEDEEPFDECELCILPPAPAIAATLASYPAAASERKRLFTLRDLNALPEPLWLVDKLVPAGGRLVGLSGMAGVGKTFAAMDLALSVACGVPWLGRPVLQSPVLYVPLEGLSDLRTRIDAWIARHAGQAFRWQAQRYFQVLDTTLALDTDARIFPELRAMPRGAFIVIDTFTRALSRASENDASELRPALNRLRDWANDGQLTIMLLQHTPWDAKRERGSTAVRGEMDASLHLDRAGAGLVLRNLKQRAGQEQADIPCRLAPVLGTRSAVFELADTGAELREWALRHEIALILREHPGLGVRKTLALLREHGLSFDDKHARELHRELSVVECGAET